MDDKNRKLTDDVKFGKVNCDEAYVENQDGKSKADSWMTVADYIYEMFDDSDQFVILTLADIAYNIRYVQAVQVESGINVQIGIEEGGNTKLVEKICSEEECIDIFQEFYESSYVRDIEQYTPVKFWV